MIAKADKQKFIELTHKIGYDVGEDMVKNLDVQHHDSFDFFPDLAMFFASYIVKHTFTRRTTAPTSIKNCICFFFKNVFQDATTKGKRKPGIQHEKPVVRVFPSTHSHISHFKKGSHRQVVSVLVSADYLKSFLKKDAGRFQFLFDNDHIFLIEEIMTDDILRTVNDIVKKEAPKALQDYHYKLKAMELLFYLFQSLSKRANPVHHKLSEEDIVSLYKVRDRLVSSLNKPTPVAELKQIAAMNELKMRRLFTQIFGMGIYDYFQYFRMKEAARLLREEKLSVSEAGYRMGFENLSHFSRLFEKHIGKKPKKYSIAV
jgi:AraC-like DNA-binding protein